MKTLSRLALAVLMSGAVCLPGFAQVQPVVPAPTQHVIRAATGSETVPPDAGKPNAGKPPVGKPAAMTEKAGSHAAVTPPPPPAGAAVTPKTN